MDQGAAKGPTDDGESTPNSTAPEPEPPTIVSLEADCATPKRSATELKRTTSEAQVSIVDLAKSPKRRKQAVGSTPFSPSKTPIEGSILDMQIGKRPVNSPIPSPKPIVVVTPPHSPLRRLVKRANEFVHNASSSDALASPGRSKASIASPLKTMLNSSNSKSMVEWLDSKDSAKKGELVTTFSEQLLQKSKAKVLFQDECGV